MNIVMFYHSLISDWNHGNAHFLRGVVTELISRGHDVRVYEPQNSWSVQNLVAEYGREPLESFRRAYPLLHPAFYEVDRLDLDRALHGADLVIVHEWNDPGLVRKIGRHRRHSGKYALLFHDTHHRSITRPEAISALELGNFDGVLAFGETVRRVYLERSWASRVWTWHEAADTRVFQPAAAETKEGDLVWIGNWGDEERTAEIEEFLLRPVRNLALKARVYGVRYPQAARDMLARSGVEYGGWMPNFRVPEVFGRFRVTLHIPRRPYNEILAGIPTIRVFEALACGIPLICSPWSDVEGLFSPGKDFLIARNGKEMEKSLHAVLSDRGLVRALSIHGRQTIFTRHTCAIRVDELLGICRELGIVSNAEPRRKPSRRDKAAVAGRQI
jgi:spore maturation protein CgeB